MPTPVRSVAPLAASLLAPLVAVLLGSVEARAQSEVRDTLATDEEGVLVRGQVSDVENGRPLVAASIRFFDLEREDTLAWEGLADSAGVFRGPRLGPSTYRIEAAALGYRSVTHVVPLEGYGTVEIEIELSPEALELEPLVVVTRRRDRLEAAGFYDRRARGFGYTLDRAEIESRRPQRITDLLRLMPGVRVAVDGLGRTGVLRMRGGCVPDVVMDGMRIPGPVRLDDILRVQDVEAVEVYGGAATPIQYSRSGCGSILVWTRDPGETGGGAFSFKRLGIGLGILLLGVLISR